MLETTLRLWKCPTNLNDEQEPPEDLHDREGIDLMNEPAGLNFDVLAHGESEGVEITLPTDFAADVLAQHVEIGKDAPTGDCNYDVASCGFENVHLDKVRPKGRSRAKQFLTLRKRRGQ